MDFQVELQVMMEITSKIQQEVEPLVGLEYLAYVIDKLSNPYFCLLCNKTGSWENIIAHFKSVNHRKRYLNTHFGTAMGCIDFAIFRFQTDQFEKLLKNMCHLIEKNHQRASPVVMKLDTFIKTKHKYKIEENENSPLVIDLIVEIQKAEEKLYVMTAYNSKKSLKNSPRQRSREQSRSRISSKHSRETLKRRHDHHERSMSAETSKLQNYYSSHRSPEEAPDEELIRKVKEMNKAIGEKYKKYDNDPEAHPKYRDEWKHFWLRECAAINSRDPNNNDFSKYDFSEAWSIFWTERLKELKMEQMLFEECELRERMSLSFEQQLHNLEKLKSNARVNIKYPNPTFKYAATSPGSVCELADEHSTIKSSFKELIKISELEELISDKIKNVSEIKLDYRVTKDEFKMLFSNLDALSNDNVKELSLFMEKKKKDDPEEYQELLNLKVESSDLNYNNRNADLDDNNNSPDVELFSVKSQPKSVSPKSTVSPKASKIKLVSDYESIESEEDEYSVDVIHSAVASSGYEAISSDSHDSEVIDLTDD